MGMRNPLLAVDLIELLRDGESAVVRDFLLEHAPPEAAELVEDLEDDDRVARVLADLPDRSRSQVFSYLSPDTQDRIFPRLDPAGAAEILHHMPHDDRADLVGRLDEEVVEPVLRKLAHAEREDIRRLASYEPGTAGAAMTTDYATLPPHATVREALDQLRRVAPDRETIDPSYVVDHNRHLIGVVPLKTLVLGRPSDLIENVMREVKLTGRADQDQEEVARMIAKYDLLALPIVDEHDKLIGIVTHDDAMDILQAEQGEDLLALSAVAREDDPASENYWRSAVPHVVRRRIVWLMPLFVSGTLTASVQHGFNFLGLEMLGVLGAFVPMLIGTGGNAGSQTVGTVIRGLALNEIEPGDMLRVLSREALTGGILGVLLGSLGFVYAWVLMGETFGVSLVIALSLFGICAWANVVGSVVPLLARKVRIDPAIVSAPLISTLVDVTGMMIYFGIATVFLMSLGWSYSHN